MCADSIASRTLARALRYFASKTKKRFAEGESNVTTMSGYRSRDKL
jgi:hypothetical protein